jgi:hypothetical protein
MANTSRVNGFRPVKHLNGSPYNGQFNLYTLLAADATATFVGDLVKLSGTADASGAYASIAQAAAGNAVIGAVIGFVPDYSNLNSPGQYRLASTLRFAMVADSPDLIFECESDNGGAALAITDVGRVADVLVGAGSTSTGQSGMQLDSSTAATNTATFPLRIMGFSPRVDNEIGNFAKVLVMINAHQLTSGAGIAGI